MSMFLTIFSLVTRRHDSISISDSKFAIFVVLVDLIYQKGSNLGDFYNIRGVIPGLATTK